MVVEVKLLPSRPARCWRSFGGAAWTRACCEAAGPGGPPPARSRNRAGVDGAGRHAAGAAAGRARPRTAAGGGAQSHRGEPGTSRPGPAGPSGPDVEPDSPGRSTAPDARCWPGCWQPWRLPAPLAMLSAGGPLLRVDQDRALDGAARVLVTALTAVVIWAFAARAVAARAVPPWSTAQAHHGPSSTGSTGSARDHASTSPSRSNRPNVAYTCRYGKGVACANLRSCPRFNPTPAGVQAAVAPRRRHVGAAAGARPPNASGSSHGPRRAGRRRRG